MPSSNPTQTSFIGGEVAPAAGARFDLPAYKTQLGTCLNWIPREDGSVTRRGGTLWCGNTYNNYPAGLYELEFSDNSPFYAEVSYHSAASYLRFWGTGNSVLGNGDLITLYPMCDSFATVSAFSNASPTHMTIGTAETWATGDILVFFPTTADAAANAVGLLGRQFVATRIDSTHYTLVDMVTGAALNFSALNFTAGTTLVGRAYVNKTALSYNTLNACTSLNIIPTFFNNTYGAFILSQGYAPLALSWVYNVGSTATPTTFTIGDAGWAIPGIAPGLGAVEWDSSYGSTGITYSTVAYTNDKAAITGTFGSQFNTRSVQTLTNSSPSVYFEMAVNSIVNLSTDGIGFMDSSQSHTASMATATHVFSINGGTGGMGTGAHNIGWAVNTTTMKAWWREDGVSWIGSGATAGNPVTGVNGIDLSGLSNWSTSGIYAAFGGTDGNSGNERCQFLTTSDKIAYTPPNGYTPWGNIAPNPAASLIDGPYLDPPYGKSQTGNDIATISDGTANPILTNQGGYSFVNTDVGRLIRLWNQPAAWQVGTTYNTGALVTYNGTFWVNSSGATSTGVYPGSSAVISSVPTLVWTPQPNAAEWFVGVITQVLSSSQVQLAGVTEIGNINSGVTTAVANGYTIDTYQLGAYGTSPGCGWPTCGTWHESRLWLFGAIPNRFDASMANSLPPGQQVTPLIVPFFSPTDQFGNENDDNGISYTMNTAPPCNFSWALADRQGVLFGSATSEGLISASTLNDPLTPADIQAHLQTANGALTTTADSQAFVNKIQHTPVRVNGAIVFLQTAGRQVIEYFADAFSQKFVGRLLNEFATHIQPFAQLIYTSQYQPILWCAGVFAVPGSNSFIANNINPGNLAGCVYRRTSPFSNAPPDSNAWFRVALGTGNLVQVMAGTSTFEHGPVMLTYNALGNSSAGTYAIERRLSYEGVSALNQWLVDGAPRVQGIDAGTSGGNSTGIKFYGLWEYVGRTVACSIFNLDCGNYMVAADGSISVPFGSDPDGTFTLAYVGTNSGNTSQPFSTRVDLTVSSVLTAYTIPVSIGFTYNSDLQLLRPNAEGDLKLPAGSGLAKTRRVHQLGLQVADTQGGLSVGTSFSNLFPVTFTNANGSAVANASLYAGVYWSPGITDAPSFDGQVCVRVARPLAATISGITSFMHTAERNDDHAPPAAKEEAE